MSSLEIFVVVVGLIAGYLVVAEFVNKKPPPEAADIPPQRRRNAYASAGNGVWHEVLNVDAFATEAEIRVAYKKLISQYHPDKVAALGPELQAVADRKTKEINAALRDALIAKGVAV